MEITVVIIVSTLPLALLLLCALFENPSVDHRTPALRATAPKQQAEQDGGFTDLARVDDLNLGLPRGHWVALPGAVAVSLVPPTVQADALQILSVLDDLDIYFADGGHEPRQDGR